MSQPQRTDKQRVVAAEVLLLALDIDTEEKLTPRIHDFTVMLLNHFRAMPIHGSPSACLRAYVRAMSKKPDVVSASFEDMVLLLLSWYGR